MTAQNVLTDEDVKLLERCQKVALALDGRHGDPLYSRYGWPEARDFARELIKRLTQPAQPAEPTPTLQEDSAHHGASARIGAGTGVGFTSSPSVELNPEPTDEVRSIAEDMVKSSPYKHVVTLARAYLAATVPVDREKLRYKATEFIHTRLRVKGVSLVEVDMSWEELEEELFDFISSGLLRAPQATAGVTRERIAYVFNLWNADRNSEPVDLIDSLWNLFEKA